MFLVFNVGSSSCKYKVFTPELSEMGEGMIEKIGIEGTHSKYKDIINGKTYEDYKDLAFDEVGDYLLSFIKDNNILDTSKVDCVVNRIVTGGEEFKENCEINKDILNEIEKLNYLAPLHNPYNVLMARKLIENFPEAKHFGVFDTAFHSTIPKQNYIYSIPLKFYDKYKIRRYGFHGSSHGYITEMMEEYLDKKVNIINMHLGSGSSGCAIKNSESINTSMGFTPLQGLVMGTRSGDIDPSIIFFLVNECGFTIKEVETILQKQSGLLGLSEISSDMREIKQKLNENENATLAREIAAKRIADYIAMYANEIGTLDGITFTGGIGENDFELIHLVVEKMNMFNIKLCTELKNDKSVNLISEEGSDVSIYIVPTNEELYMAKQAVRKIK